MPPGIPPLLITLHGELRMGVNVHSHLHGGRVRGLTRHLNVSVEQVHYRPAP